MSALTGLAGPSGGIPTSISPATVFRRAMGFDGGALRIVSANPSAAARFNGSVWTEPDGAVCTNSADPIAHWNGGIPLTAAGALAVEPNGSVDFVSQGVGFAPNGRVATTI